MAEMKKSKKAEKKTNKNGKIQGMISKKMKKSAGIDLAIDVVCPPLGAIRHFKRSMQSAEAVETVEKAVDVILGENTIMDLYNLGASILPENEETKETEEETNEKEKEEA